MSRSDAASPRVTRCERPIRLTSFVTLRVRRNDQGDSASVSRAQLRESANDALSDRDLRGQRCTVSDALSGRGRRGQPTKLVETMMTADGLGLAACGPEIPDCRFPGRAPCAGPAGLVPVTMSLSCTLCPSCRQATVLLAWTAFSRYLPLDLEPIHFGRHSGASPGRRQSRGRSAVDCTGL